MTSQNKSFATSYSPLKKLGEGGYGTVWLVSRLSDGALYAAKIIKDEKCKRKTWCKQRNAWIPDEIMLSENLKHQNLLDLHEIYFEQNCWIILMEYLSDFVDLFEYIGDKKPMSTDDIRHLMIQAVDVCNYLICKGIDHRDIKDENILYNPITKQIKLIDFGSASLLSTDRYSRYQGTEVYLPPEYHTNKSYSALPATTWALGCLAYVLLNGDCPFHSPKDVQDHKKLRFINPSLDQQSKDFLEDLLNIDEDERLLPAEILCHPWLGLLAQ